MTAATRLARLAAAGVALVGTMVAPRSVHAQERGATALGELVAGLGVSVRVLVIGAHPDDEDNALVTWLARREHAEVGYLSLTRGDGGQNLIGPELGEALGVIRTEELLAARRVDGAHQYFARAYDFGFSKSADEAFTHWPHDSLLRDVVTVVRAFRPHVIISMFSGTPIDGHGQHQVSGIIAREAFDAAADTGRLPRAATAGLGGWAPLKFYRGAYVIRESGATTTFDVGEYAPLLGRSYYEIAAESRSRHRSQGEGQLQRKGVRFDSLRREATRIAGLGARERSPFDGIDTTYGRLRRAMRLGRARAVLDSLGPAIARVRRAFDPFVPERVIAPLARVQYLAGVLCTQLSLPACAPDVRVVHNIVIASGVLDAQRSLSDLNARVERALQLATGVAVEATTDRDAVALGDSIAVTVAVYNRGREPLRVGPERGDGSDMVDVAYDDAIPTVTLPPDSVYRWRYAAMAARVSTPWWLASPRRGDVFAPALVKVAAEWNDTSAAPDPTAVYLRLAEDERPTAAQFTARIEVAGASFAVAVAVVYRYADPARGDVQRPLAVVPAVSVTLDDTVEYAVAGSPFDRTVRASVRAGASDAGRVSVMIRAPAGLAPDSAARPVILDGVGEQRTVSFRLRGRAPAGRQVIAAGAARGGSTYAAGYVPIEYEHIRPQKLYRPAELGVRAVDVRLPPRMKVAYIVGVGDNSAPVLAQLGVPVTVLEPARLASTELSAYTAVVVGTRAYEASRELVANNARLLEYVRNGGTLVVQYGQFEMARPGMMPYPITLQRPAARVTDERSPVRVLDAASPVLHYPNTITDTDFQGWVQDRALYMPSSFDPRYTPVIATNDPGEPPNQGGILIARVGRGTYVYTTLAFFRQLPAGVPGAARLFVNLLSTAGTR